jgi:hypothetical protein
LSKIKFSNDLGTKIFDFYTRKKSDSNQTPGASNCVCGKRMVGSSIRNFSIKGIGIRTRNAAIPPIKIA